MDGSGTELDWPRWFAALQTAELLAQRETRDYDTFTRLSRAREFIDTHFDRAIDLDAIAEQACFSRYHFLRSFRRAFDVTPHQYVTQRRIERAKELLTSSALPITEICYEVGFHSLGSFSSLFHRHVGHSPSRYRTKLVQSLGIPVPIAPTPIPACFFSVFRAPVTNL